MPSIGSTNRAPYLPSANPGNATAETQVLGSNAALLICPWTQNIDKRPMRIRAAGRCVPGASSNLTVALYFGVSTTIASNIKLATTGALAAGTAATNWMLEIRGFYDSVSLRFMGLQNGFVNATAVAQAIFTTAGTSIDTTAGPTTNGFNLTVLYGTGNASHALIVDVFEVIPE